MLGLPSTPAVLGQMIFTVTLISVAYCGVYALIAVPLGKKLGGKGTFKRLFLVASYSLLPAVLFVTPQTALMGLIWSFCLAVIGVRVAHGIPLGRAITVQAMMVALSAMLAAVISFGLLKFTQRHYPAERLVHQPVPADTFNPFVGAPFQLDSFMGKSVVVIDFWATWCSPCREALPGLARIAQEYADKNVVVLAVSNDDDWQTAQKYLTDTQLNLTGIKGSQKLNQDFLVEGIPQTVIVDKSGVVQWVHVGTSSKAEEALRRELDRLLAQ